MSKECFGIYLLKEVDEKYIINLSNFNFLISSKVKEFIIASAKEIMVRTKNNSIINLEMKFYETFLNLVGIKTINNLCIIYTNENKPHDYLITLAHYIMLNGLAPTIDENFAYIESNTIKNIQQDLNVTKFIMIDNIEQIIKRGEKLDDLVNKSQYLTIESKKFYGRTKKLNQCCILF